MLYLGTFKANWSTSVFILSVEPSVYYQLQRSTNKNTKKIFYIFCNRLLDMLNNTPETDTRLNHFLTMSMTRFLKILTVRMV